MEVVVTGYGSISSAGTGAERVYSRYRSGPTAVISTHIGDEKVLAARLEADAELWLETYALGLERQERLFDRASLMAAYACEMAAADWEPWRDYAVVIGSARGATSRWEQYFSDFSPGRRVSPFASPVTTAGSLAALAAARLSERLEPATAAFVVSQTCVSAAAAVATATALIRAGVVERALAGGAEAPLTPFTWAAMRSTGAYANYRRAGAGFPCRPLASQGEDTMVMGEGAAVFSLENAAGCAGPVWAKIVGVGLGTEKPPHLAATSADGAALQAAMRAAVNEAGLWPDAVVMHAPGTLAGDAAELAAIDAVWRNRPRPYLYAPKWLTGHALGAAPALALEAALLMLRFGPLPMPYPVPDNPVRNVRTVMVNAAGFGGGAASLILHRPD